MLTCHPLPDFQQHQLCNVKRIELFIIPCIEIDDSGFRACMCLTTNQGYGWSELFISDAQKPTSWNTWSATLSHYIGVRGMSTAWQTPADANDKHSLIRQLCNSAIQDIHHSPNVKVPRHATFTRENNYNNSLMDRSIFYLSLF